MKDKNDKQLPFTMTLRSRRLKKDSINENNTAIKREYKEIKEVSTIRKRIKQEPNKYIKAIKQEFLDSSIENYSNIIPPSVIKIREKLLENVIPSKKALLMRYFKTKPGEYAEGDQFFGIPVPGVRSVIKYCSILDIEIEDLFWLLTSSYHEERMLASFYMTELSKKLIHERKKQSQKGKQHPTSIYNLLLVKMNQALEKYQCHTIPELVQHFIKKEGCRPGERKGWDVEGIMACNKRQKEKWQRIGESRPIFLDQVLEENSSTNSSHQYQFHSNLGFTDPIILQKQILFEFYVECMPWIDNWDLVDLTCREIIGSFLEEFEEERVKSVLYHWVTYKINDQVAGYAHLSKNNSQNFKVEKTEQVIQDQSNTSQDELAFTTLWTKRVALLTTFYFIQQSEFRYTMFLLETLLDFSNSDIHGPVPPESIQTKERFHDLIEKAAGWMLREVGKRDGSVTGKGCKCQLPENDNSNNDSEDSKEINDKNNKTKGRKRKRNPRNDSNNDKNQASPHKETFDLYANKKYTLRHFLNRYAWKMPRTMLRYSIEKFPSSDRNRYLRATEPLE